MLKQLARLGLVSFTLALVLVAWQPPARAQPKPACENLVGLGLLPRATKRLTALCELGKGSGPNVYGQIDELAQAVSDSVAPKQRASVFAWIASKNQVPADLLASAFQQNVKGGACTDLLPVLNEDPVRSEHHPLWALTDHKLLPECWAATGAQPPLEVARSYFVSVAALPTDVVYWLADEPWPLLRRLEPVAGIAAVKAGWRFLAVPKGHRGTLAVYPNVNVPPMTFDVDETAATNGGVHVDTITGRRSILVDVCVTSQDQVFVSGVPLAAKGLCPDSGVPWLSVEVRQIIYARPSLDEAPELLLVRRGIVRDRALLSANTLDRNLVNNSRKIGMLPVEAPGCAALGIDPSIVATRIKSFLARRGEPVEDIGTMADLAKSYVAGLGPLDGLPSVITERSRGNFDPSTRLGSLGQTLFSEGFADLLQLRVSCGSAPDGTSVFSIGAIRASLQDEDDRPQGVSAYRMVPFVATDAVLLNEGAVSTVAKLWNKPSISISSAIAHSTLHDDIAIPTLVEPVADEMHPPMVHAEMSVADDATCEQVDRWNRLRTDVPQIAKPAGTILSVRDWSRQGARTLWLTPIRAWTMLVRAWVDDGTPASAGLDQAKDPVQETEALQKGLVVYRCVSVEAPPGVLAITYFPPQWLHREAAALPQRPEVVNNWFVLGRLGARNGFGISFGYWNVRRYGSGVASWNDPAASSGANALGQTAYRFDIWAVSLGPEFRGRLYPLSFVPLLRRVGKYFPADVGLSVMGRVEVHDSSGVPAGGLGKFSEKRGYIPLDLSLAATLGVSCQFTNELSLGLDGVFTIPRLGGVAQNQLRDDDFRQTIWYDPTYFLVGAGVAFRYAFGQ